MIEGMNVHIKTSLPGPISRKLMAQHKEYVADAFATVFPVFVRTAKGATITDVDGNRFIDFAGGVGVLNVGHANPALIGAVSYQASLFFHTDYTVVPYESFALLAKRLLALSPFAGSGKAAFFNSGSEAVENAVKIARLATGRPSIIAFDGAFHGRTLMAMTLTSKAAPYKKGMGPLAPEVYRVAYPYPYRGINEEEALEDLEWAFKTQVDPSQVAAIIIEPLLGEGGFLYAGDTYLQKLREICDREGILLIADEVQTGFGRTGKMFAIEHSGVVPDLICIAKSIAGGLPLSGVLGKKEIMDAPHDSAIGGTYPGNPIAIAAALRVLDEFERLSLVERAQEIGRVIRSRMEEWERMDLSIGAIHGLGAMLAIEFVTLDGDPDPDRAKRVIDEAFKRGLMLLKAGVRGNSIRVLVPFVITDAQLAEALDIWEEAISSA
jgi:4-aminobutyrate aminotransferase/(S)-3-amino-2-methylpropionate transaminase